MFFKKEYCSDTSNQDENELHIVELERQAQLLHIEHTKSRPAWNTFHTGRLLFSVSAEPNRSGAAASASIRT